MTDVTLANNISPQPEKGPEDRQEEYSLRQKIVAIVALIVVMAIAALGVLFYVRSSDSKPKPVAHGYTLTPPAGWQKQKESSGASVVFASPTSETDTTGSLKPFIAVQASPLNEEGQKAGFAKVSKQFQDRMAGTYSNYRLISSEDKTVAEVPALLLTFSFTQDNTEVTARSLFTIKYGVSYVVNGETLTSTWPEHADKIEQSLGTFRP